jgi:hypothetical protein
MPDTSSPPPLSLVDDQPAVQVLRLVRSLLMQAERLSVSEDSLARMGTVLVAQTAIETLLRCAWERLTDKSNDNAQMVDVENLVLLDDPAYDLVDDEGNNTRVFESGCRSVLAVALARWAWESCNSNVLWPATDEAPELYTQLEYGQREQQDLQRNFRQREQALQFDVLALVLGIRQADVRRFRRVKQAGLTMNPFGKWWITFEGSPRDEPDARFAVEFATDWILRAQQHVR